ncbi:MAG: CRISPR-associated protein Cas4 [Candidatus Gastranaerophilales bacterium]|jgi:CRISPR-associated exonuclease Cas4|nr:CRISPR-associated protein Cas4 [Candidatus Gastranaerophilales bacterium]
MYSEDDLLQLSALQHFVFCRRQCALIHIEQIWEENRLTAEGRIMHEDVHKEGVENRKNVRIERGIPLRSLELGLSGNADVVEFHRTEIRGKWIVFPVEYKRGKPKPDSSDMVQLCAQAMCLEEMLKTVIPEGALFYGKTKHRLDVRFSEELRLETGRLSVDLHEFICYGKTPPAVYSPKCDMCSLIGQCMPMAMQNSRSVSEYIAEALENK